MIRFGRRFRGPLFWVCSSLLAGVRVAAGEVEDYLHYDVGRLSLRPLIGLGERYDDNIFYRGSNEVGDFATYISPGFDFLLGDPDRNYIELLYIQDNRFYADNDQLNAMDHSVNLQTSIGGQGNSLFYGKSLYQRTFSLIGLEIVSQDPVTRTIFNSDYRFQYRLTDKSVVYVDFKHSGYYYSSDTSSTTFVDSDLLNPSLGYRFDVLPKTSVFSEVEYGRYLTESSDPTQLAVDSSFFGGFIGIQSRATTKFTYVAKVGYQIREREDGVELPDAISADILLRYAMTPKRNLNLSYRRRPSIAIRDSATRLRDEVAAGVDQYLGPSNKILASLAISYVIQAYDDVLSQTRDDSYFLAGLSVSYKIQPWLTGKFSVEHARYEDSQTRQYDANRVFVQFIMGLQ
jgi:hypothetical protein